jgi:predicted permease
MTVPDDVLTRWRREAARALPNGPRELIEEVALHLASRWVADREKGTSPEEADAAAWRDLDGWRARSIVDSAGPSSLWQRARQGVSLDVVETARRLRKRPVGAAAATALVAIALAANLVVGAIAFGVFGRPLPYPEPDRLVTLWQSVHGDLTQVSYPDFADIRQASLFDESAAIISGQATLIAGSMFDRVGTIDLEPSLLSMLGARAVAGRLLVAGDAAQHLVMISHRLWSTRFGKDPGAIGRSIVLSGQTMTIVGVLQPELTFELPVAVNFSIDDPDVWMAFDRTDAFVHLRQVSTYEVVARLAPNVPLDRAQRELDATALVLQREYASTNKDREFRLVPLGQRMTDKARLPLMVAAAGALLMTLIALVNLTSLQLAARRARAVDHALRTSLGASAWRLLRHHHMESCFVAVCGGAAGFAAADALTRALLASAAAHLPREGAIRFDAPVLAYGLLVLAVLVLVPAMLAGRSSRVATLRVDERVVGRATRRSRHVLVALEVAVAITVAAGAALLGLTVYRLSSIQPGFEIDRALSLRVSAYAASYPQKDQALAFFDRVRERVGALGPVDAVGLSSSLPLSGQGTGSNIMSAEHPLPDAERLPVGWQVASPGYFRAAGIPILRGRDFAPDDVKRSRHPTIVSDSVARALFGQDDPIGRLVSVGGGKDPGSDWHEVIGVVGDIRHVSLDSAPTPRVYDLLGPHWGRTLNVVTRARDAVMPETLAPLVRRSIAAIDPTAPIFDVRTMGDLASRSVASRRLAATLAAAIAAVSVLLALVGTAAVVACTVSERLREFGVRLALGATPGGIRALVLRELSWTSAVGCLIGAAGSALMARLLASTLVSARPSDATVVVLVLSIGLTLAALVAAWIPTRRAGRVDPITIVRD